MKVKRERVSFLNARNKRRKLRRQSGERAERAVYVKPQVLFFTYRRASFEIVDRSGVHRSRVCDEAEWPMILATIRRDCRS